MKKIISMLLCSLMFLSLMIPVSAAENIAIGKRAFASSEFNDLYCVANINDGDHATAWSEGDIVLTGDKGGYSYIAVDLGGPHLINQIVAVSRQDFDQIADRSGWVIQVSNDPEFEKVKDVGRRIEGGEFKSSTVVNLDLKEAYRYVRVCSRTYAVVAELEVYGEPVAAGGIATYNDIDDEKTDGAAKFLSYLDILGGVSINEFGPKHLVTRAEAAKVVTSLINASVPESTEKSYFADVPANHPYAVYINSCVELGIVSQADNFSPDAFIKTLDFTKMLLTAMGYGPEMIAEGGYPQGVALVAKDLKIDKGLNIDYNKDINRETVSKLLLNAFKAPILRSVKFYDEFIEYNDEKTLLERYYNMSIKNGIVTANNVTTLSESIEKNESYVEINGEKFIDNTLSIKNHVGENIFYVTDDNAPNEIILYWGNEQKTETVIIKSEDITECNYRNIVYEEENKKYDIDLESDVEVIKNGVSTSDWVESDFKKENTYIKAIDNDSDGIFEVVHYYDPTIIVADFASDKDKLVISGKNGEKISIDMPDKLSVKINGKDKKIADIASGDVIYAYVSENKKSVELDVSTERVDGVIQSVENITGNITIDDKLYESSVYYKANKDKFEKAEPGKNVIVYLNTYGEIVYIEKNDNINKAKLGFIQAVDTSGMADVKFKIFTQDGSFNTMMPAERITIDGTRMTLEELFDKVNESPEYFAEKFVSYALNSDGNIAELDTENYIEQKEYDSKMIKADVEIQTSFEYLSSGVNGIYDRNMMILPMKTNTPTFVIPTVDDAIVSGVDYDGFYDVITAKEAFPDTDPIRQKTAFYGQDELGFPTFAVLYRKHYAETTDGMSFISSGYANGIVVDELNLGLDADGSAAYVVSGYDIMTGKTTNIVISNEVKKVVDSSPLQQKYTKWLTGDWLLNSDLMKIENMTEEELADYNEAIKPITDISRGDIIRCQMQGSSAAVVERVYKNNKGALKAYSSADGSYYNSGPNASWPFAYFRLVAGNVGLYKDGFVKLNLASGYDEVFEPETVLNLFVFDGKTLKKYEGKEFLSFVDENSKVVLFTQRQKNLSVIIYNN